MASRLVGGDQAARVASRSVRHPPRRSGFGAGRRRAAARRPGRRCWPGSCRPRPAAVGQERNRPRPASLPGRGPARPARARRGLDSPGGSSAPSGAAAGRRGGRVAALGRSAGDAAMVTPLAKRGPDPGGKPSADPRRTPLPMRWRSPRTATRQIRSPRRDAVPGRKAPGEPGSPSVRRAWPVPAPCPSSLPRPEGSRRERAGQGAFGHRGPRDGDGRHLLAGRGRHPAVATAAGGAEGEDGEQQGGLDGADETHGETPRSTAPFWSGRRQLRAVRPR